MPNEASFLAGSGDNNPAAAVTAGLIRRRVREAAAREGLTLKALAQKLGVSYGALRNALYEQNTNLGIRLSLERYFRTKFWPD